MGLGRFDVGDQLEIEVTFRSVDRLLTDPTAVVFRIMSASLAETSFDYGVDPEVTRLSTGVYRLVYDLLSDDPGTWSVRCQGTGSLVAAVENTFEVRDSAFVVP